MTLKPSDLEAIVELFGQSEWDELHVEIDGEEILLSKDAKRGALGSAPVAVAAPIAVAAAPAAAAAPAHAGSTIAAAATRGSNWIAIKAANLGTFYKASSPEAAPYVSLGTHVTAESEVCMIEVMKLFTTIRAGTAGIVREICATDGQMVEFGQELMWIEPV